ncbi:MAG: lactate utilization protein [Deltaproteobacteria bacterium]|jgi:L-lactate utilization protein LutB
MHNPIEIYWKQRIEKCKKALENNNFDAYLAEDTIEAHKIIMNDIIPKLDAKSASWGDSMTLLAIGILDTLRKLPDINLIETFAQGVPREEIIERRRKALLADIFFSGSNAITETGKLVNLDMVGNRIAGIIFGPQHVIITAGRNKIVSDVGEATRRIKNYAAPLNAIRHPDFKTPCRKTSYCMDCKSPDRICNTWAITEKSYPKGRIKVLIINKNLGL